MQRLNPKTGKVFKHGDVREDGYVFVKYLKQRIKSDGYFQEQWLKPESFLKINKRGLKTQANRRKTPLGRAYSLINSAKARVGDENVLITAQWVYDKIKKGKCELTGLPFDLEPCTTTRLNPYAPSIDRIDSSIKVYNEKNTRIVLASVNSCLGEYGEKTMLPILKAMIKAIRKENK